jgi:hypothetical protein
LEQFDSGLDSVRPVALSKASGILTATEKFNKEVFMKKQSFFSVFEIVLIVGMGAFIAIGVTAYESPRVCESLVQITKTVTDLFIV